MARANELPLAPPPKLVLPKDPEAKEKMQHLFERVLATPADEVLLCLDECDVHLTISMHSLRQ